MNYKAFPILLLLLLFSLFPSQGIPQIFNGSVYVCTSDSKIIRIDSILNNPSEVLVCKTSQCLLDIGYAPDNSLYGVYGFLGGSFAKILPDGTFTGELFLPYLASNALSFDQYGTAYIGFDESSVVVTVDVNKPNGNITTWHDFGIGRAAGDFIFLNNRLYIAWRLDNDFHLYEIELSSSNKYVSHRDLGLLPEKTYGLASDKQDHIFGVTENKQIYSFSPPTEYTNTIPINYLYTFQLGNQGYGATSKSEAFGNTVLDFGDAPQTFLTGGPDSSCCHIIVPGLCLGKYVDGEDAGIPAVGANSDDNNSAINDDDGITFTGLSIQNYSFLKGCTAMLSIEHTGKGYLSAWFDWNRDGTWSDNEMEIAGLYLENGNHEYPVTIPANADTGTTYCRFRFSSEVVPKSHFYAKDGEVEDYVINIVDPQVLDTLEISSENINACLGNIIPVSFKSPDFKGVISINLTLNIDTAILSYIGITNIYPSFGNQVICNYDTVSGTITVTWNNDAYVSVPDTASLFDLQFKPLKTGVTQFRISSELINSNSVICNSVTIPFSDRLGMITIYNPPKATTETEFELCEHDNLILAGTATGDNSIVSYHWKNPDGTAVTDDTITLHNLDLSQSGWYGFYCTDAIGCSDSVFTKVTIKQIPEINFAGNDTIYYGYGYILEGTDHFDYCIWNTGATSPEIEIMQDGLYWLNVELNGCENSDSVYLFGEDRILFLPNAFTPNNDGKNDIFKAIGTSSSLQYFNMMIFSRWGNMVFETSDISKGWDGTYKNELCPAGAYVCIIRYTPRIADEESEVKTVKSSIILLR